jgi:hypothetical protein
MEPLDNEKHARISSAPGVFLSNNSVSENPGTLKRMSSNKHKKPNKEDKLYDSSSPTSVENMEEGGESPSVLHPASKKLPKMEQNVCHLAEVVANITEKLAKCMENQISAGSNMQAIIEMCQNFSEKILSQGSSIKSFHNVTDSI